MLVTGKLLAWIEPVEAGAYQAAFVSAAVGGQRPPATHRCRSSDEARQWVESQATALGVPVEWVASAAAC